MPDICGQLIVGSGPKFENVGAGTLTIPADAAGMLLESTCDPLEAGTLKPVKILAAPVKIPESAFQKPLLLLAEACWSAAFTATVVSLPLMLVAVVP